MPSLILIGRPGLGRVGGLRLSSAPITLVLNRGPGGLLLSLWAAILWQCALNLTISKAISILYLT